MIRKSQLKLLCVPVGLVLLAVSTQSYATPSFARQTGRACQACHFQHFPTLNAEGREFADSGFTDMGKQALIEKDGLSLPSVENVSVFTKIRFRNTNGEERTSEKTSNSGQLDFPDEFVLFYGGRVASNIGFLLEAQLPEGGAPVFASFKMPFTYRVAELQAASGDKEAKHLRLGVVPFTTDALGVAYGFEHLNTGALRSNRIIEPRADISAQQFIGTSSAANGLAFVASSPLFFVNISKWSPNHAANANGTSNGAPSATYFRAALTPQWNGWDFGFGLQSWRGKVDKFEDEDDSTTDGVNESAIATRYQTAARSFDFQAQGKIGGMPLGVYLTSAKADKPSATTPNLYNSKSKDKKATSLVAELGVIPKKLTAVLGYRSGENGGSRFEKDTAITLGVTYSLEQNVLLQLLQVLRSGSAYDTGASAMKAGGSGDQLTMFVLSAGF